MFASVLRSAVRPSGLARAVAFKPAVCASRVTPLRFLATRYSTDHEWVTYDEATNIGTVGITDYAQKALGDVVFVELPAVGTDIAQGDSIGAVESVKAASDIYAPVAGIVEEINEELNDQPGLLNKDPEAKGWLCKVKLADPAEFDTLLNAAAYKAHCEGQAE